uniref:Uncharacterized protein AlNc14C248G9592 n=1 Tax=Albugo laibachii Nc14 TaxID=890382 RepID=F0WTA7_9STRA|nr:conserved hypothetical protein [Albugo laibachii Nc14]|eukprot:CCA24596.1 conserved hypothetical protein [Albugo laibachii Nc14]
MGDTDATDKSSGQTSVAAGCERAGEQLKKDEEGIANGTQEKLVDLLTSLGERMEHLEASQKRRDEEVRLRDCQASVFGSSLVQGRAINHRVLDMTPPRDVTPTVSPATYFGMRQPGYTQAAENIDMVQAQQHQSVDMPGAQAGRVPDTRQRAWKSSIPRKELYLGLGSGFLSWGKRFVRQIQFAERACGFPWSEDVKVDVLGHHSKGMAKRYYIQQVEGWWEEEPTLEHAIQRMFQTFSTRITPAQIVSEACGGADNLVLDNAVHYADPTMRVTMLSRLNLARTDYLRQTEELAHFAQSTEIKLKGKKFGRDLVSVVHHE